MSEDFAEHCPECADTVTCYPVWVSADPRGDVRVEYRCPVCRARWYTTFNAEALQAPEAGAA